MKAVVIKTDRPETMHGLLGTVRSLFPDCEIRVVTGEDLNHEGHQAAVNPILAQTDAKGRTE